jgi:hypothetical protein
MRVDLWRRGSIRLGDGRIWAEPDVAAAIDLMCLVVADPNERARRAARGQRKVVERYSPSAVAKAVERRLEVFAKPRGFTQSGGAEE